MNHTSTTPRHLSDDALMRAIREHLAEAARRPSLESALRHLHAGELEDLKAAMLAATDMPAEAIAAVCHVDPEPDRTPGRRRLRAYE